MNVDRIDMVESNSPSGSGWRNFVYYEQIIISNEYVLYDYGAEKNQEVYGQADAPHVPIENYDIPTAMFYGDIDQLAVPEDVEWIADKLGDKVIFKKEYHANHASFICGNDMTMWTVDALGIIEKYNPLPTSDEPAIFLQ